MEKVAKNQKKTVYFLSLNEEGGEKMRWDDIGRWLEGEDKRGEGAEDADAEVGECGDEAVVVEGEVQVNVSDLSYLLETYHILTESKLFHSC